MKRTNIFIGVILLLSILSLGILLKSCENDKQGFGDSSTVEKSDNVNDMDPEENTSSEQSNEQESDGFPEIEQEESTNSSSTDKSQHETDSKSGNKVGGDAITESPDETEREEESSESDNDESQKDDSNYTLPIEPNPGSFSPGIL